MPYPSFAPPIAALILTSELPDERIQTLEQEIQRVTQSVEESVFAKHQLQTGANGAGASLQKQPSFKWAMYGSRAVKSPTGPTPDDPAGLSLQPQDSPRISPQALEHDLTVSV